jgi:hypothetical protein
MRLEQMSIYTLYLVIEGEGLTPPNSSHWSFVLERTGTDSAVANILQVLCLMTCVSGLGTEMLLVWRLWEGPCARNLGWCPELT